MEIFVRTVGKYYEAKIEEGNATINIGLLNDAERKELAKVFLQASEELLNGLSDDA